MALDLEIVGEVTELTEVEVLVPPTHTVRATGALRESHHGVARLIALGERDINVSRLTGYSPGRIATLRRDPAFQELVAFYTHEVDDRRLETMDYFEKIGRDGMQELHQRILDGTIGKDADLIDAVKTMMDRAGYAPVQRSITRSFNHSIAERMDEYSKKGTG